MTHKISVDQGKCIGCGACEATCPKSFKISDGKASPVKTEVETLTCEKAAETGCPVGAIKIE